MFDALNSASIGAQKSVIFGDNSRTTTSRTQTHENDAPKKERVHWCACVRDRVVVLSCRTKHSSNGLQKKTAIGYVTATYGVPHETDGK